MVKPIKVMQFQIGKGGITPGVIDSLKLAFKTHKFVRISVLKSAERDRESIKKMAAKLVEAFGGTYRASIIGFTIVLKRRYEVQK